MKTRRAGPVSVFLLYALLILFTLSLAACGGGGEDLSSWERDPIVPGYSMADVDIGSPFSAVQEIHGDPDQKLKDGGYHYAYYGRIAEAGKIDDPASWRMVVTLYDNGNGYLDAADEVGSVEVSAPYYGATLSGVGIGSSPGDIEAEFGPCESVSETRGPGGEDLALYSYPHRGIDFLVSRRTSVITVIVTAYGGLETVDAAGGADAKGGLFGIHGAAPIVPGQTAAGIIIGDEFRSVRDKYGGPDSTGSTTEGLVFATYTGGYGTWKLNVYLEDSDGNDSLGDFDLVVSISVRFPYAGRTPKGVGIASSTADAVKEFGPPERQTNATHQGEELTILEFNSKGIVFAARAASGEIVEIDVNRSLAP
ncbi:MAG: hypothetical protein PHP28_11615 [Actinomycetota bacterium]|nr:hypothetical protein [Actinomycetota bacterium]MDD5666429.1 hypothetical protein [Actinomycetota bacterium]